MMQMQRYMFLGIITNSDKEKTNMFVICVYKAVPLHFV
jgi:hypothetical protein